MSNDFGRVQSNSRCGSFGCTKRSPTRRSHRRLAIRHSEQELRWERNTRKACRSRSDAEIISKMESTLQELDETSYWLELLVDSEIVSSKLLGPLIKECDEITRMLVTAVKNIKRRR